MLDSGYRNFSRRELRISFIRISRRTPDHQHQKGKNYHRDTIVSLHAELSFSRKAFIHGSYNTSKDKVNRIY